MIRSAFKWLKERLGDVGCVVFHYHSWHKNNLLRGNRKIATCLHCGREWEIK